MDLSQKIVAALLAAFLLIALLLVLTAHMRENDVPDAINPMDELIDRELMQDEHRKQTKSPPHE